MKSGSLTLAVPRSPDLHLELRFVTYDQQQPHTYASVGAIPFSQKELEGPTGRVRARLFLDQLISQTLSRAMGDMEVLPKSRQTIQSVPLQQLRKLVALMETGKLSQKQVTTFDLGKNIKILRIELSPEV
jgi:hypothetical protein